jgi:hypothetical protein
LNLYAYCYNNPVKYWDPTGHVVTDWDRANLTIAEQARLAILTSQWNAAQRAGDTARMNEVAAQGAAIRAPYLANTNLTQRSDGHVVNANGTIATGQVTPANTGGNNLSGGTQGNNSSSPPIPTMVYVPVQGSNNAFIQLPGFFVDGNYFFTHNEKPVSSGSIVTHVGGGWVLIENGRIVERVNKPSNVLNEDLGGIQLIGNANVRNEILGQLNKLTDHTLGMRDITPELSMVYINTFATDIELINGNRLISNLLRNPNNHTTFISYNNEGRNLHTPGINNTSSVQVDPSTELQLMIIDSATGFVRKDENNVPVKITIAHELIHAHRFMRGIQICSNDRTDWSFQTTDIDRRGNQIILTDYSVQKEELATIGLNFHTDRDITENMIRAEQRIILRGASYYR